MAFSKSIHLSKRLHHYFLSIEFLLCMLVAPTAAWSQSGQAAASDSLRARHLLTQGLEIRDKGNYILANSVLVKAAALYQHGGYVFKAAHCYNHVSSNYRLAGKLDSAEVHAHKALSMIANLSAGDPTEQIRSYTNLGLVEVIRADYKRSRDWLQKAYRLIDSPSVNPFLKTTVLGSLGYLYDDLGNYDRALASYGEALKILNDLKEPPKGRIAKLYNNIGYTYRNMGQHDRALEYYKRELELGLEIKDEMHPDIAIAYINIGSSYYRRGDCGQAILYFQKSLDAALAAHGEEHEVTVINYENIGLCHLDSGEYDEAVNSLERVIKIKRRMFGDRHPDLAVTLKNLGHVYAKQKNYTQALIYTKQALAVQRNSLGESHPMLADTYTRTGRYFAEQSLPDSALQYLVKGETIALTALGPGHPVLAQLYGAMAIAHEKRSEYSLAASKYHLALEILSENFRGETFSDNPALSDILYPVYALDILFDKAKMYHLAFAAEDDTKYLKASLSTFGLISGLLDKLQAGYVNEQSKMAIGRKSHSIYEHAIEVAFDLYRAEGRQVYLEQLLYFAEKSKARIMLESAVKNGANQYAHIPDSLLTYERSLRGQMGAVQHEMNVLVSSFPARNERLSSLRDSLIALNKQLGEYSHMLDQRYPSYHALKFANHIPSVSYMQSRLAEKNLTVVEFFLGEESLFAVVITENGLHVEKLHSDSELPARIHAFNQAITRRKDSSYHALGYSLYNTLIKPIESMLSSSSRLLIIADGEMALLPFEALLTRAVPEENSHHRDLPYLLWKYDIAYAPSLALSSVLRDVNDPDYKTDFLAFAPGFSSGDPEWHDQYGTVSNLTWKALPFSRLEVSDIASLFTAQLGLMDYLTGSGQPKLFLDDEASEYALKNISGLDARYIHMATHAFVSNDQSRPAGILLYPDKSHNEDGILFSHEIYSLTMNTELVVLSACETGRGSVVKGEGIMSLSRAFQFAGVENLLVSLWKVEDRSSARLMVEFYQSLVNGSEKITALQDAKRRLIRGVEYAHPFYWAPFILIGS